MKLIGTALGVVLSCAAGATAQSVTTVQTNTTTINIKDGKRLTVVGCIAPNPGGGFMLTEPDTGGMKYALVTDDDLTGYVAHRAVVVGKVTDQGDARMKIESKVVGTTGETKAKTEVKGDLVGLHYLGVKSVKAVPGDCK
jgi:hypothetical protein